jgi:hypothetical protein
LKALPFPQGWVLGALLVGVALSAACLAPGVDGLIHPARLDGLVQAPITDGWGARAAVTDVELRLLALFGLAALLVAGLPARLHGAVRTTAALVVLCAHIVLTERMTQVTGQAVSRGWGLW